MIKITPLFSGSKGNCTLVQTQKTNILLDLGYGYKQTVAALSKFGLAPNDISAVVYRTSTATISRLCRIGRVIFPQKFTLRPK